MISDVGTHVKLPGGKYAQYQCFYSVMLTLIFVIIYAHNFVLSLRNKSTNFIRRSSAVACAWYFKPVYVWLFGRQLCFLTAMPKPCVWCVNSVDALECECFSTWRVPRCDMSLKLSRWENWKNKHYTNMSPTDVFAAFIVSGIVEHVCSILSRTMYHKTKHRNFIYLFFSVSVLSEKRLKFLAWNRSNL